MTRREIREHLFKELFLAEFYDGEEFEEQCQRYREEIEGAGKADLAELEAKARAVAAGIPAADEAINAAAKGWRTSRMGKVELTLLRLALYEMREDDQVPVRVAINEAVELAKKYGGEDSSAFINAILGNLAKGLDE